MSDFGVIYADPPWRYGNMTPSASPENHYPTMPLEDICALDVPAAKNAVLYLWATAPLLPEGLKVMESWGFTYKSSGVWDKQRLGVGYWFRGQHEHLLVGVKGNWSPPPVHLRVSSIYSEHSGRHSSLEMFCRYPSPGWHVWGNQVDSTVADLPFEKFDPSADPAQDCLDFGAPA